MFSLPHFGHRSSAIAGIRTLTRRLQKPLDLFARHALILLMPRTHGLGIFVTLPKSPFTQT